MAWVGEDFKDHLVPSTFLPAGCQPLNQTLEQVLIQQGLDHRQERGNSGVFRLHRAQNLVELEQDNI